MKIKYILLVLVLILFGNSLSGQKETYSIEAAKFNTKNSDEFSPVYFGKGIVFCSNRNMNFVKNYFTQENKGLLKILYADTLTGKVRLFSKDLKTKFNDGPASFTRNSDTIYFSRNLKIEVSDEKNSPRNKLGIFTATLEDNRWGKILDIRFNNEYFNITTPFISPDGKRLFFASDNPSGYGGSDIYYCNWKVDYWDEPINLGPDVNTSGNESYPFVNNEGALFFSSEGHAGLGGKDIFYTKEVKNKWIKPVNLDPPVNSKYDDFALIADAEMKNGFFSTNRGGTIDIYEFKTNIHQLFYCEKQKTNSYCFRFSDDNNIQIDSRYLQLTWNFGDGGAASGLNVEHCFKGPGIYNVKLEAIDKKSGQVFFTKVSYTLDLKDVEQPVISMPSSSMAGEPVNLSGLSSNYPGYDILNYTWNFGDGNRAEGEKLSHKYLTKGDYEVRLGVIVKNKKTEIVKEACSIMPLKVFADGDAKTAFDKREIKPEVPLNVMEYEYATVKNMFAAEKYITQDAVYRVEVLNSRRRLQLNDKTFEKVPKKYALKEEFLTDEMTYSYTINEEMNLMATYPAYSEMITLGYSGARIVAVNLENPVSLELNNLKKVFGLSADTFFRKNDAGLTSEGTQVMDLVLGFMTKYPDVRLEVSCHSDNSGQPATNLALTQKRADAMVYYLLINGVDKSRLLAKGFGSTLPIAPNYQESDRKLNRRIDFRIVEEAR